MELDRLNKLIEEVEYLKKSHELLNQLNSYINPYDKKINGKDCGDLLYKISEHFGFDDSE